MYVRNERTQTKYTTADSLPTLIVDTLSAECRVDSSNWSLSTLPLMTVIFNMSLITAIRLLCFLPYFVTSAVGDASSYCERPWPSIELFLPYKLGTNNRDGRLFEFESLFLRSFLMFWPHKISNVSLNVGIDVEKKTSKRAVELGATIQSLNISGGAKVSLLPSSVYYRTGYDRQQYVMMWADNFTNKEYIGFVDSDAVFLTYVDREDLFEDGKPVVNARSGYHMTHKDGVHLWSVGSYETLGFLEPFKCMSYFPVIVKREHLKDMRDFISQRHNLSFDDVFYQNISSPATTHPRDYSQFAIMCSYLYQFKRDEYKWYVHSETPGWDGLNPPPPYGQDGNISQFTPEMNLPKPRITTHGRYRRTKTNGMVRFKCVLFLVSAAFHFRFLYCMNASLCRSLFL